MSVLGDRSRPTVRNLNWVWDAGLLDWVAETQPGGSGGGAVTIADGADVAQGSRADVAWVAGNGTVISLLKKIASAGGSAVSIADGADVAEGVTTDSAVITDTTGTLSGKLRGLVKWAFERMPASLGQKAMAASLPVVLPNDQSAIPVTNTNLDVALSTRLKAADTLAAVTTIGTITNPVAVTNAGLSNLDVLLSTRTKPSDQQHVIIDSSAAIGVTGPLTDVQLRASPVPVSGTVTANQGGAPWTANVTQFGSNAVVTGIGAAAVGVPRVTVSDDNTETTGTVTGTGSFTVALAGRTGAGVEILAGTLAGTILYEYSADGGSTYATAAVIIGGVQNLTGSVLTNPNPLVSVAFICGEHWTHVRARCSAFTSGSAAINVRATKLVSPLAVGALNVGLNGGAVPFFSGMVAGKAVTGNLPTAVTNGTLVPMLADVYGRLTIKKKETWAITHVPAAATQATIAQASAGVGVKNVCTSVSFTLASTAAPTALLVRFNLRDGASGAGTILQSWQLSLPAVAGQCVPFGLTDLWIEGSAATAMTLESAAAPGANVFATVAMTGTITI